MPTTTIGTNNADVLRGAKGEENNIAGRGGDDTIVGRGKSDLLLGGAGEDILFGANGSDTLYGGRDNDTIGGGNGADFLSGDKGADVLTGGNGDDVFFFRSKDTGSGVDTITDFTFGDDSVLIRGSDALVEFVQDGGDVVMQIDGADAAIFEGALAAEVESSFSFDDILA